MVDGILTLSHVRTKDQPTDIFTKALGKWQFQYLKCKLDMTDLHAPTCGRVLENKLYYETN